MVTVGGFEYWTLDYISSIPVVLNRIEMFVVSGAFNKPLILIGAKLTNSTPVYEKCLSYAPVKSYENITYFCFCVTKFPKNLRTSVQNYLPYN